MTMWLLERDHLFLVGQDNKQQGGDLVLVGQYNSELLNLED